MSAAFLLSLLILPAFADVSVQTECREDECHSPPLVREERVAEDDHRGQDGKKFACRRKDGAHERTKVCDRCEYEQLWRGGREREVYKNDII